MTTTSTIEDIRRARDEYLKDPNDFNKLRAFNGLVMHHPESTSFETYFALRAKIIKMNE